MALWFSWPLGVTLRRFVTLAIALRRYCVTERTPIRKLGGTCAAALILNCRQPLEATSGQPLEATSGGACGLLCVVARRRRRSHGKWRWHDCVAERMTPRHFSRRKKRGDKPRQRGSSWPKCAFLRHKRRPRTNSEGVSRPSTGYRIGKRFNAILTRRNRFGSPQAAGRKNWPLNTTQRGVAFRGPSSADTAKRPAVRRVTYCRGLMRCVHIASTKVSRGQPAREMRKGRSGSAYAAPPTLWQLR